MPGAFISYRRRDSAGWARAIHEGLCAAFGDHPIFIDVDDIAAGETYADFIAQQLQLIDVMVAVIGPRWITVADAHGRPRLENSDDLLRQEIATALKLDIDVIPVLVDDAGMPSPEQLPDDLKRLAALSAFELAHERFDTDVDTLVRLVGEKMGVDPQSIELAQDIVDRMQSISRGVPESQPSSTEEARVVVLPESRLSFVSDPGDWVGQGLTMELTPDDYDFTLWEQMRPHSLRFELDDGRTSWDIEFEAPRGEQLSVAAYRQAERAAFKRHNRPGFDFSGDGRAHNDLEAEFEIKRLDHNELGTVVAFQAEFAQRAAGESAAVRGSLAYYAEPHPQK